jgi:hypothetical protein
LGLAWQIRLIFPVITTWHGAGPAGTQFLAHSALKGKLCNREINEKK